MLDFGTPSPERELWCAVLQAAIEDACKPILNPDEPDRRDRDTKAARTWLALGGDDRDAVVTLAGLDPRAVAEWAHAQAKTGWRGLAP